MARLTDIARVLAEHRVDKASTLAVFSRNLREAGRLSQAGRGHAAARVSNLDAARLMIACAATDRPASAVDTEATFSGMVWAGDVSGRTGERDWINENDSPTLDIALANLLGAVGTGEVDRHEAARAEAAKHSIVLPTILELHVHRDASGAVLRWCDRTYQFQHSRMAAVVSAQTYDETQRLMREFEQETYRFRSGKHLRAELDASLLRAVAETVAGKRK